MPGTIKQNQFEMKTYPWLVSIRSQQGGSNDTSLWLESGGNFHLNFSLQLGQT